MKGNYIISEEAINDLEDIWLYTLKTWSQKQADRYYNLLINEIEYISTHFDSGKIKDHIKQGYRASKVKSHIIFYRKNAKGNVEIIRILHERMDVENQLNK